MKSRIARLEKQTDTHEGEWEICNPKKEYEEFIQSLREVEADANGTEVSGELLRYPEDYPEWALRPPYKIPRLSDERLKEVSRLWTETLQEDLETTTVRGHGET